MRPVLCTALSAYGKPRTSSVRIEDKEAAREVRSSVVVNGN
ncbi:hypothetical protein [Arcanobacterium phocisimile]|nr:hypothetical protein [Arcanobacterium phocisimile]